MLVEYSGFKNQISISRPFRNQIKTPLRKYSVDVEYANTCFQGL